MEDGAKPPDEAARKPTMAEILAAVSTCQEKVYRFRALLCLSRFVLVVWGVQVVYRIDSIFLLILLFLLSSHLFTSRVTRCSVVPPVP